MSAVLAILWKDAVSESRGLERLSTLGLFSAAVLLTLNFSVDPESPARRGAAAGFLWACLMLAAMLELRRGVEAERRDGTLDALRAAPVDPAALYLGKLLSALAALGLLSCAVVPPAVLLATGSLARTPAAIGVVLAGLVGLLAWGTLLAAATSGTASGELVLPVLLFPLVVPQTIACVRLLGHILGATTLDSPATGLLILGAFDVIALGTGLLLFDYAVRE
ncbi:MAG TPA: heme exporter protein CcmB [Actinomycetota bacterium]|nr:heme exporter protein CcmB [Actinomycetota bacterium]